MPQSSLKHPESLLIAGEWVTPRDGATIEVVSPVDGRTVARVAAAGASEIDQAARAAKAAFEEGPWASMPLAERLGFVERLISEIEARREDLAKCWTAQIGALASVAPMMIAAGLATLRHAVELAREYPFEEQVASSAAAAAIVRREAVGAVAAVVPWNAPFTLLMAKLAPALVTGCTLVVKPSPETPLEALIIGECAQAAGLPPGVVNVVPADRARSAELVAHPAIDKVSFTGSTAAGRAIAAVCAARMARCTLELGGKSAAIVLEDYPVEDAARLLADTIIANTGQICSILSRAVVPRAMQDPLAEAIARRLEAVTVGDPNDPATRMGPLASRAQHARVVDLVASALEDGARLVTGGDAPSGLEDGCFFAPTLFADVDPSMRIAQEEVFGPVLCLIPHDGELDAIRIANGTIYGLNGAVLTTDPSAAWRVARGVRSGKFSQNAFRFDFALPSGGMKQSGIGREGGREGLEAYLETKVMLMDSPPAG